MPLTRVTLTGADDRTDPEKLLEISHRFPFVEWGVLISSNEGVSRYPTLGWIDSLATVWDEAEICIFKLSLHCCGKYRRAICSGYPLLLGLSRFAEQLHIFDRIQLNTNGTKTPVEDATGILTSFYKMFGHGDGIPWIPEVIFQLDNIYQIYAPLLRDNRKHSHFYQPVTGLFDCSGGKGITPSTWPAPASGIDCGYAGGLGPDNVLSELARINDVARPHRPYWIDMESKLRTPDGSFSLAKCIDVLEQCQPYIDDSDFGKFTEECRDD